MKKEFLLKYCHYYDGAEENTFEVKERNRRKNEPHVDKNCMMLWFYEKVWCAELRNAIDIYDLPPMLQEYVTEYKFAGLETYHQGDGVPLSLKALLFNRYMRGSMDGNVEPFKRFYYSYYGLAEYAYKTRSQIIERCHYYKGEEKAPEGVDGLFWDYEKHWVDTIEREFINNEPTGELWSWIAQYRSDGLYNFRLTSSQLYHLGHDETPLSLKALLYNRYCQLYTSTPDEFKKWYKASYCKYLKNMKS